MKIDDNPESPAAYRKLLETDPTDNYAATNHLTALLNNGGIEEAREICRLFHLAGGTSRDVAIVAARICFFHGGFDLGHAIVDRARRLDPDDGVLRHLSYLLACLEQDYRGAMAHAKAAARLDPTIRFQPLRIHTPLTV